MQFIKKNYEKILLGLVLFGLVVVAVFLVFLVASEKQAQEERRKTIIHRTPKALSPVDLTPVEAVLKRLQAPAPLLFSDSTNKLFNPERWQKPVTGPIIKNPVGTDLQKLLVTRITNLYLVITIDAISPSDAGPRFTIGVEQQSASRPNMRGRRTVYASKGEKKEYGEKKESLVIQDVQGPPDNPVLTLELGDSEKAVVSKDKPFRRVDGHLADLKYPPENKPFPNRREGDPIYSKILVAGEDYNVVRITDSEVVLQGKNLKKWPIYFNPATAP